PPHRRQAARHRSGPPSAPPAVPRPTGTGAGASNTSPALDVGASQSLDRESPQKSSPTLPMPLRRAADGVGMEQAAGTYVYRIWLPEESRKSWERVTQKALHSHEVQEHTVSPHKRYATHHAKASKRRRLKAQERLARDRRQAQHAAAALEQALHDLGLPDDLVTEIEGRLRSQHKLLGKIVGV